MKCDLMIDKSQLKRFIAKYRIINWQIGDLIKKKEPYLMIRKEFCLKNSSSYSKQEE